MKILLIGFTEPNQTARVLAQGFEDNGHTVNHIHPWKTKQRKLSDLYSDKDLVIIFQTNTDFINDLSIVPVLYFHLEILSPASLDRWTYLFYPNEEVFNFLTAFYYPAMCEMQGFHLFNYCINLTEWSLPEKPYHNMTPLALGYAPQRKFPHFLWHAVYDFRHNFIQSLDVIDWSQFTYYEYKQHLLYGNAAICVHGNYCYLSQRIFEAAAAACCPIIYIGNSSKTLYMKMGLHHGSNCLFFTTKEELQQFPKLFDFNTIGQRARQWIHAHHTAHLRAKEVITYVQKMAKTQK